MALPSDEYSTDPSFKQITWQLWVSGETARQHPIIVGAWHWMGAVTIFRLCSSQPKSPGHRTC